MKGSSRSEKPTYLCQTCGHRAAKWMGFCPQCRTQEPLVETIDARTRSDAVAVVEATAEAVPVRDRDAVGIVEIDRVLGGGVVPGSVLLVGGEPGVGKSTLLLQFADAFSGRAGEVLIATAEESAHQVQMRARRVGVASDRVQIAAVYDVDDIIALAVERGPAAVIVDSIQTVSSADVVGAAGGVSQVRESAARLITHAKTTGMPIVLVGHVTKDGSIAGPRTLEHMVDVVLYLEGDADHGLRLLRSIKNRYGSVNEIGIFEMTAEGLLEVPDPSGLLIADRDDGAVGTVLFPMIEGKRPMMVEIQALAVASTADQPRRSVTGFAPARLHQILGVLERHAALPLGRHDVYVSVMGGVRITEPGADLPVALAVASAFADVPLRRTAAWGELGLTGDIRRVGRSAIRSAEAERVGADPIIAPGDGTTRLFEVLIECGFGAGIR
jgi:DNA repair protein RadA/Sms